MPGVLERVRMFPSLYGSGTLRPQAAGCRQAIVEKERCYNADRQGNLE